MDYTIRVKFQFRGQHYVLQNLVIMQVVQVTVYMMNSSPFMGEAVITKIRHTTTAFEGRHTAGCNALSEFCKINQDHRLLSLPVSWVCILLRNAASTQLWVSDCIITARSFQHLVIPYPLSTNMTSSRYLVSSTVVNCEYHNAVGGRHSLHLAENLKKPDLIWV